MASDDTLASDWPDTVKLNFLTAAACLAKLNDLVLVRTPVVNKPVIVITLNLL